jgi:hypothetical protein
VLTLEMPIPHSPPKPLTFAGSLEACADAGNADPAQPAEAVDSRGGCA